MSDNLDAALSYANRNWQVLRCHHMTDTGCSCGNPECNSPGKHPRTRHGHKDATTDPEKIKVWWEEVPQANIGIRTGAESGIWVLDLDGPEGIEALTKLEAENEKLPETPTASTGGGGRHLFFAWPSAVEIKSRAKISGFRIDTRGSGGYVVAPPSNHASGNVYVWDRSPEDVPLANAPQWLLDFVSTKIPDTVATDQDALLFPEKRDLRTAPGVPEGGRHKRALELIGAHLGRGEHPLSVLKWAFRFGDRCQPRMERDEILRIVSDLHDKDLNRFDDEPAKEEIPWPTLNPVALYGLAGEIVRVIEPQTEADPVAILAQLLVFFGNMIGRNPHFRVEATNHFANLFAVLVGQTAKGRKGTSEARVRELFESIHDDWLLKRILTGLSSGEGLIWAVRDPIEKTKPVEEDGRIIDYQTYISDHGVADKRLLLIESEFASVLRIAKRDGNILSTTIRAAWDSGNLQIMTKNSPARATNAHISIIGHITKEELLTCMSEVEGFNGFANRFKWLCVKRSQLLPKGGAPVDLSSHRSRLQDAVDFAKSIGEMQRDARADELWAKLYEQMDKGHSGMFGAVTSRSEAQVLRLSLIYALLDETKIIRTEHLQAAMALWQYAEDSARYIFGSSTGHKLTDTLLRLIREQPRTKKELHDKTNRHYAAKELDQALAKLERLKLIKRETVENTGGRPAIRWSAI